MIDSHPNVVEVDDGYEIEPGVRVLHTPGHSPGSLTVVADTAEGPAAITGDVLHFASAALTRVNPLVFWNAEQATKSIERILATTGLIYPGHDRPFRVLGDKTEYLEPFRMSIGGIRPDMEGLAWQDAWPASFKMPWVMPGIEQQTLESLS
jgi:glyoxylase-like metal-dependent hydrolase (beta-lactamase superfamily II)